MGHEYRHLLDALDDCFSIRSFGSFDGTSKLPAISACCSLVSVSALSDHLMGLSSNGKLSASP